MTYVRYASSIVILYLHNTAARSSQEIDNDAIPEFSLFRSLQITRPKLPIWVRKESTHPLNECHAARMFVYEGLVWTVTVPSPDPAVEKRGRTNQRSTRSKSKNMCVFSVMQHEYRLK